MNNYRNNQEHDLRDDINKLRQLQPLVDKAERNWQEAEQTTIQKQLELRDAKIDESKKMEIFRAAHSVLNQIKARVGETQEEFFRSAEEQEDWRH